MSAAAAFPAPDSAPAPGPVENTATSIVPPAPAAASTRWTAATPDPMASQAVARVLAAKGPAVEREAVAAMALLLKLSERASYGHVRGLLAGLGTPGTPSPLSEELRGEASVLARRLAADEGTEAGIRADRALGILTDLSILGPFRDTGGGLDAHDGPEGPRRSFGESKQEYSWGAFEVRWRTVPASYATAAGVPLDLFVHPRKESCTWVASKVRVAKAEPMVVRVAATGQVRLMFDGVEVARSEDVHGAAVFDRVAARVQPAAGAHLVAAKVCTGALEDEGRVRLRVTRESGAPLVLEASGDLRDVPETAAPAAAAGAAGKAAPASRSKVDTPLTRTLSSLPLRGKVGVAGSNLADIDAMLDATVARTLGGADDAKSPRAPGLLDAITRSPKLDADRLALAAWIAPSGSNRSGWLQRALERAEASKDEETRAFVERRRVAEHLRTRMADWAMASLRGAKLIDTADPESVLLRAETYDALGSETLRIAAMVEMKKAADRDPDRVPTALLVKLLGLTSGPDAARAARTAALLAKRGYVGQAYLHAESLRGNAAGVAAAQATFARGLDDPDDGVSIARTVSRMGEHDAARKLFAQLVEWTPNRADAWGGLADELATMKADRPDLRSAAVAKALERARALAPGEARYRAQLALGSKGERDEKGAASDERYLVPSQTILARRQGVPKSGTAPDVADRQLYWLRAVVTRADKRISQLIQYGREVVIAPRTQDELFEDLPAEGDLTEILRARVHRKDGGTAFPVEEHNEGTRPRIRWPELGPGDVVEVAIRTWTSQPVGGRGDAPFYFLDYSGAPSTHPLAYNEVVVDTTKEHPIYLDVVQPAWLRGQRDRSWAGRREERDENGRHITRLVWDKPIVVPEEPLAPALSEIVPLVVGSSFKDWDAFRTWYREAVRGFTEPDDEVRRIAAELTKGKTSREAKLKALFDFVADDIRYVNYVSGEWWLPNRPQQLLARREGDCDDKAILLITLLKSVGIEAQEVMVQTRQTGQPSVVRAKNAAVPMFDHGIAFLPGPGGGRYLDATSPQSRLGPIPAMDARAVALRMDSGPAEIVELPASSPDDHGADVTWNITLHPDGSGDLVGEEKHIGDGAFWLRTYLTQADARTQYVENNLVGGWFPTVQVDNKVEFDGELANGQAWVKYSAHSDGLARHEPNELVLPLAPSMTLSSSLAPLVKRTLPVALPASLAPSRQRRTIRIVAPPGFSWGELPPGGKVSGGDFGSASLEMSKDPRDPRAVIVRRQVIFDKSQIPVDQYAAWRTFLQQTDALMHKSLRLAEPSRRAGSAPAPAASDAKAVAK
ncbi:transglutaminase domain-containing protein [Pendulispora albinea]|uniref:Transglutaminase-like domain-containing protein n=1 Tax=Pendulispora albinea TaxID=2741071 RepID=A0ABZ2M2D2_9BACT